MNGPYVHIPFCTRKCPYCSFYSVPGDDQAVNSILKSIEWEFQRLPSDVYSEFQTVYIGGGTPSSLNLSQIDRLLKTISPAMANADEITVEVNPETFDFEKAKVLKGAGVNRISIGIQSLNDRILKILGRTGDAAVGWEAIRIASETGFENVSIDLMYGIPGQTMGEWMHDLVLASETGPEHISFYGLSIDEGTPFATKYARGGIQSDEMYRKMYFTGVDFLKDRGYIHYEISNFAKPGYESKHNSNYWEHGTYAGLGPSASGFNNNTRWRNVSNIEKYNRFVELEKEPTDEREVLTDDQLISESMMLGLRKIDGINLSDFSEKYGRDFRELYSKQLEDLTEKNMLHLDEDILRLTREGIFVSDSVISEFILVAE